MSTSTSRRFAAGTQGPETANLLTGLANGIRDPGDFR
jgi:hypothetical protein